MKIKVSFIVYCFYRVHTDCFKHFSFSFTLILSRALSIPIYYLRILVVVVVVGDCCCCYCSFDCYCCYCHFVSSEARKYESTGKGDKDIRMNEREKHTEKLYNEAYGFANVPSMYTQSDYVSRMRHQESQSSKGTVFFFLNLRRPVSHFLELFLFWR